MPFTDLDGLKPSTIRANATAAAAMQDRPLNGGDYASWRAYERYGIHQNWPYVTTLRGSEPLHPIFLRMLRENPEDSRALCKDLRGDVLDAVTTSDLVGCNLSVLLTSTGRTFPGTPVTADNIQVDVYVTPHELRVHEEVFEEAVAVLTQIFIEKMAIPHTHEVRRRGTSWGFIREHGDTYAMPPLIKRNPWPQMPISLTERAYTTHQTMTGWPQLDISPSVVGFLRSVFHTIPEITTCAAPSSITMSSVSSVSSDDQDEFDRIVSDDTRWPSDAAFEADDVFNVRVDTAAQSSAKADSDVSNIYHQIDQLKAEVNDLMASVTQKKELIRKLSNEATARGAHAELPRQGYLAGLSNPSSSVSAKVLNTEPLVMPGRPITPPHPQRPSTPRLPVAPLSNPPKTPAHLTTPPVPSAVRRSLLNTPRSPVAKDAHGLERAVLEIGLDPDIVPALRLVMERYPVEEWHDTIMPLFDNDVALNVLVRAMKTEWRAEALNALNVAFSVSGSGKGRMKSA